jgi:hypothetical protein
MPIRRVSPKQIQSWRTFLNEDEIKTVEILNGLHHKYVNPVNYGQFVDNLMMAG